MGDLDEMIGGLNEYAGEHGLEPITILRRRRDPDGGFEATVSAHNWNPIKWVKKKVGEFKEGRERRKIKGEEEEKEELTRRQPLLKARREAAEEEQKTREAEEEYEEYEEGKGKKRTYRKKKKGVGAVVSAVGAVAKGVAGIGKSLPAKPSTKRVKATTVTGRTDLFDVSHMRALTTPKFGQTPSGPRPTGGGDTLARLRELTIAGPRQVKKEVKESAKETKGI